MEEDNIPELEEPHFRAREKLRRTKRRRCLRAEKNHRAEEIRILTKPEAEDLLHYYFNQKPPYHFTSKDPENYQRLRHAASLGIVSKKRVDQLPNLA